MFLKNSRYATVPLFDPDLDERSAFRGVRPRPIPPTPGAIEHMVTLDDRPDRLANNYFAADRLWWRVLDANPDFVIAGPLHGPDGEYVSGGDGVVAPEGAEGPGDVMISERTEGDAILIPRRGG